MLRANQKYFVCDHVHGPRGKTSNNFPVPFSPHPPPPPSRLLLELFKGISYAVKLTVLGGYALKPYEALNKNLWAVVKVYNEKKTEVRNMHDYAVLNIPGEFL